MNYIIDSQAIRSIFLWIALFFSFSFTLQAQKYDKYYTKLDQDFANGNLKMAKYDLYLLKEKLDERYANGRDSALIQLYEGKLYRLRGDFNYADELTNNYLFKIRKFYGENSKEYLEATLHKAYISYDMDDYKATTIQVNNILSNFKKAYTLDSEIVAQARMLQAKVLVFTGRYNEAEDLVKKVLFKGENRLLEKKEVEDKKGKKKFVKFSKEELDERKRYYAYAQILNSVLQLRKGEYEEAESSFLASEKWIKKNLSNTDVAFVDLQLSYSQYWQSQNQPIKVLQALKLALKACNKKGQYYTYLETHPKYLRICEVLMEQYVYLKRKEEANKISEKYKNIIATNFPDFESYRIKLRIPFSDSWERRDASFALLLERCADDIEKYRLPFHYAYEIYKSLYQTCVYSDSLRKAEFFLNEYLRLIKNQCGEESVLYHTERVELGYFLALYTDRLDEADKIFNESLHGSMEKYLTPNHNEMILSLNKEAEYFAVRDRFQKALTNLNKVKDLILSRFEKDDVFYGLQIQRIADVQMELGDYSSAEKNLIEGLEIIKDRRGKDSRDFLNTLSYLTKLYVVTGRYDEAKKTLTTAYKVVKNASTSTLVTFNGFDEEVWLMLNKGLYTEAEERLESIIAYRKKKFGTVYHRNLILPYRMAAELHLLKGNYSLAEDFASKSVQSASIALSDSSLAYWKSQASFCRIYSSLGDYERAEEIGTSTLNSFRKIIGGDHPDITPAMIDLALVKFYRGESVKAVSDLLTKALEINKKNFGEKHPRYAETLQYMAALSVAERKPTEAMDMLNQANKIWLEKLGSHNAHTAEIDIAMGDIYRQIHDYQKARDFYAKGSKLFLSIFTDNHPKYINTLSKLGQIYYIEGNYSRAASYCEKTTKANIDYINQNFPSMSDREKSKYWQLIRPDFEFYYTLAMKLKDRRPEVLAKLFDINIITKAILLSNSIKVRERIMNSGDPTLRELYKNWLRKKEDLTSASELTPDERNAAGLNVSKLEAETEKLEKLLGEKSEDFKLDKEENKIRWKDVRNLLDKGEYVVDIVRYRYFDTDFTDSVIYAALILNQKSKVPGLVLFEYGKTLETKYINHYRNCIKYLYEDELSYDKFWKPLKEMIPPGSKIFFSPDGVFNELNVETLKNSGGRYIIEEEDINVICNAKDIFSTKVLIAKSPDYKNDAFLVGDPDFYKSTPGSNSDAEIIAQLPGTRKEVSEVNSILKTNRWETKTFLGKEAREEALKVVKNPRILHVATHGFFKENQEQIANSSDDNFINRNKATENPLMRSGLLLNNAGEIIKQDPNDYNPNIGDGILTAYEAMNLSLDATDLVVLSACETGLGEIQVGEGVFGLQRAFQIAGAKSVIMSLFKVADDATQDLMITFYKNWINQGMDRRKAFSEAKKAMMLKRPQPLYWGAFIMVGVS